MINRILFFTWKLERIIDDPLRTLAYGTDASFYRYCTCFMTHLLYLFQFIQDVLRYFFWTDWFQKLLCKLNQKKKSKELSYYQMKRKFQSLSELLERVYQVFFKFFKIIFEVAPFFQTKDKLWLIQLWFELCLQSGVNGNY